MKLFIAIILANFLLTFVTAPKVLAAEGDILISDNFNDGNLDGWTIQYGNWYVNPQGNLAGSASGRMLGGRINTGNSEWDNYRIDLDIDGFQGIDSVVGFRYTPNGNLYELNLRFGTGSYNTPEAILRKVENGVVTNIADTHSLTLTDQQWYHLKTEVSNENIKVWINNNLIFDVTDAGTNIKKGTLTLSYWTGDVGVAYMKFDNIVVTALAPPLPPKLPVIFIPGIGGSELKASQDIIWSSTDGHNGTFSHAYANNEKIWVNQDEAAKLGEDDYFDILRLKADGVTPEASLALTGNMNPYGYSEIDSFFTGMGYVKGTNFFVFNYDWRKDIRETKDSLDALIESAKTASGQSKVNLVVHSMGGLIARFYISDPVKAAKVNKLIELGVPHLGATSAVRTLMYGFAIQKNVFGIFPIGIPSSEVKDASQNNPSLFQLLPSNKYFDFYNNYPFRDDRDIDNNATTGSLTYDQTKSLLLNLSYNMTVFGISEQFHNFIDPILNQTNGTKIYEIVGTAQPTLGQIHETWWITWPINLIPKTDEIYINGDDTVPLYSASLKNDSQDLSGATKIYYVEQRHGEMPKKDGISMQTVKSILNDDNALPTEVKAQKIALEGEQLSLDDGELDLYDEANRHCGLNDNSEMEENIPDVTCTTSNNTRHAFVKKKAAKVKITATRKKSTTSSKTTNIKIRVYSQDKISKTTTYKDISIPATGKVEFSLDPSVDTSPTLNLYPDSTKTDNTIISLTSEVSGSNALDQTSPSTKIEIVGTKDSSGIYSGPVTISLTGSDSGSGILRIEYSLDNGVTVQTYTDPFIISASGKTTIQVKAIDKTGNEESPQTITIEISVPPTPTPTPTSNSSSGSSDSSSSTSNVTSSNTTVSSAADTPKVGSDSFGVDKSQSILGVSLKNPNHVSDRINIEKVLEKPKKESYSREEILTGLLIVTAGIFTFASLALFLSFPKPFPTKMQHQEPKGNIN